MCRLYHVLASDTLKMKIVSRMVILVITTLRLILTLNRPGLRVLTICIIVIVHTIVWRHSAKLIGTIFAGVSALAWLVCHLRLLS